jgi:3-methyladenine DNA glycosylase/8-oxoguanine DNA glycosylase
MNERRTSGLSAAPETSAPTPDDLEAAADQAIAACGGDAREAVKVLIIANGFLEEQIAKLKAAVSTGYARAKFEPRDRKDWYD